MIVRSGSLGRWRYVAGADAAFSPDGTQCIAAVVVWDRKTNSVTEQQVQRYPVEFPYVPGLLSFREAPALLKALRKLSFVPDVFLFDAQGLAHPRRLGLASHLGLWLNQPCIGCAKTLLTGSFDAPARSAESTEPLRDRNEVIGAVVRSRADVKPLFVSIGNKISLSKAVRVVLECCRGFRLPEPTRLADRLVRSLRDCK